MNKSKRFFLSLLLMLKQTKPLFGPRDHTLRSFRGTQMTVPPLDSLIVCVPKSMGKVNLGSTELQAELPRSFTLTKVWSPPIV